ncbi:MAG: hypothetical protein HY791_24755 [Deltaproteobacteria bacterium]|nr:hypothetical protein [Deltaproteobacteria bacterium]
MRVGHSGNIRPVGEQTHRRAEDVSSGAELAKVRAQLKTNEAETERTEGQLKELRTEVRVVERDHAKLSKKLGEIEAQGATFDVRIELQRRLVSRLENEADRPANQIVSEERGRCRDRVDRMSQRKRSFLARVASALEENGGAQGSKGPERAHHGRRRNLKAQVQALTKDGGVTAGLGKDETKELRTWMEHLSTHAGDAVTLTAAVERAQGTVKAAEASAKAEIAKLAKAEAALATGGTKARAAFVQETKTKLEADVSARSDLTRLEQSCLAELMGAEHRLQALISVMSMLEAQQEARAAERQRLEEEAARLDAEYRQAKEKLEQDARDAADRKYQSELQQLDQQRRIDTDQRAFQARSIEIAQQKAASALRQLEQLTVYTQNIQKDMSADQSYADVLTRICEACQETKDRLHEVFEQADASIATLRAQVREAQGREQVEHLADAGIANSVASFIQGMIANAEANDSTAISVPVGIRVASNSIAGPAIAGIEAALDRVSTAILEGDDDVERAKAAVSWGLGHGLMPHPDDLATLLRATPGAGRGWGDKLDQLSYHLSAIDQRSFANTQLQSINGQDRIEIIRNEAKILADLGPDVLVSLLRKPEATDVPPAPMDPAQFARLNWILDQLWGHGGGPSQVGGG